MELRDVHSRIEMLRLNAPLEACAGIQDEAFGDHLPLHRTVGTDVHDVGRDELSGVLAEHRDVASQNVGTAIPNAVSTFEKRGRAVHTDAKQRRFFDPELYRAVGLEPKDAQIVVVKSAIQFRAGYPFARRSIMLDRAFSVLNGRVPVSMLYSTRPNE